MSHKKNWYDWISFRNFQSFQILIALYVHYAKTAQIQKQKLIALALDLNWQAIYIF